MSLTPGAPKLVDASREPGAPLEAGGIPLCVPQLGGNEWRYVKECLDSGWVSSVGGFVDRFERGVAEYVGANAAVATASGTAALHVALLVAGVRPDDEVVVSTLSFISPANAIRYTGAWPVFVDAEPQFWQMDPFAVRDFLERGCNWRDGELRNRRTGRVVRAIVPVHVLGHPVDMDPLLELADRYRLVIIEDGTESLGAVYRGRKVGSLGHLTCFSFNGNKIITTGGGGMVVTNDESWARRARYLTTQAKADPVEYVHDEIGYNYRLTNIQAAVGCAQMELLGSYLEAKRRIARTYVDALGGIPGITPMREASWATSAFWMYTVLVDQSVYGVGSRALLRRLDHERIQTRPLWEPLHRSRAHSGAMALDCPVADRLNRDALSLPCSVGLSPEDQRRVIRAIVDGRDSGA